MIASPSKRGRFEGVVNIVRFNWPMFAVAVVVASGAAFAGWAVDDLVWRLLLFCTAVSVGGSVLLSLAVSHWVYDCSRLYQLPWMEHVQGELPEGARVINIHSGFDECSGLVRSKLKAGMSLESWDFFDPVKHTEPSILRARSIFPPPPDTVRVRPDALPAADGSVDLVCAMLAAHEIRSFQDRVIFFSELRRITREDGGLVVTEHLRDAPNLFAYNVGALHFHSRASWLGVFRDSGWRLAAEQKVTPFVSTFVLRR